MCPKPKSQAKLYKLIYKIYKWYSFGSFLAFGRWRKYTLSERDASNVGVQIQSRLPVAISFAGTQISHLSKGDMLT
jgi:hypothetical protein